MRTLLALALVLAVVGCSDHSRTPALSDSPAASSQSGPDLLVVRVPRAGGTVRAYAYDNLDSAIWSSPERAPATERLIGFDDNLGLVTAVDRKGVPLRIDLRLGTVGRDTRTPLTRLASADGSTLYGIDAKGEVRRLTPADSSWSFRPARPAKATDVVPQRDGSLIVLGQHGDQTLIWHLRPPAAGIIDSTRIPLAEHVPGTQVGDQLYLAVDSTVVGVRGRDLKTALELPLRAPIQAIVTTPSGDRVFVALAGTPTVAVIDRYAGKVESRITLPAAVESLRMDPTGRYVLAHPAEGDSAWVIPIGTERPAGAVATGWRSDLPFVAPDGSIALLHGKDVVIVDGETLEPKRTVKGGAADLWLAISWNGFRPQASELEAAAAPPDTTAVDSLANPFATQVPGRETLAVRGDSGAAAVTPPDSAVGAAPRDTAARWRGFTVQFAALTSEQRARDEARGISVDGLPPDVVATSRNGVTIYRVVAGPYPTRVDAERAARTTTHSYWIYEGPP